MLHITHLYPNVQRKCSLSLTENEALGGIKDFKTGGRATETIGYADDLVLLAKVEETIRYSWPANETVKNYTMEINVDK